ncbi:MAG TPA: hypothetical protein VGF19_10460 [Candidatus Acidoferrum sp.]
MEFHAVECHARRITALSECGRVGYGRRKVDRTMIFGHNTNVKVGEMTFHVQTEDRGEAHGLIDTTVYYQGRVLHRRTNNYYDLRPLDEDRIGALKLRLDEQHRVVLEEMHSGKLPLALPPVPAARPAAPKEIPAAKKLQVELLNPKAWLNGKHVSLVVAVKEENGGAAEHATVKVEVEGAAYEHVYSGEVGAGGQVKIEFEMPRITAGEAAILIRAENGHAEGHLRFALKAKPRVPSV